MNFPSATPQQARIIWWALTALALTALLGFGVGLIWVLGEVLTALASVLWPLAIAGVLAYLLDPVVDQLEQRRIPRPRAILLVFVLAALAFTAILMGILPQIYRETRQFVEKVPVYSVRLQEKVDGWMTNPPRFLEGFIKAAPAAPPAASASTNAPPKVREYSSLDGPQPQPPRHAWQDVFDKGTVKSASHWLTTLLPRAGEWLLGKVSKVASVFGVLAGLALVPVYAFYFLLEKRGIALRWTDYVPLRNSRLKDELVFVLRSVNDYLIVFFRSQLLVATCDGILYAVGFFLVGVPYAVLLGVMATFLTMIPFLGAIATCVAALILAFVQYGDWLHPALVLVVFGVVQALEGLVISPKIMGDRVGLHPLTIIIAVMVGTTLLGGILGGVLAIPFTAALRVLMFRYIWRKRVESPDAPVMEGA